MCEIPLYYKGQQDPKFSISPFCTIIHIFLVARAGPSPRDGQIPNGKYVYTGAQELYIVTCTVIMIEVGVNALTKSALRGIKNGQIISVVDKEPPNSKGNSKLYEVSSHNKIIL